MKYIILTIIALTCLLFAGCSTLDSALFSSQETPLVDASGNAVLDAAGNQIYEVTYKPSALSSAAIKVGDSLPGVFGYIGAGLAAVFAGVSEYRRKRYVKTANGEIKELETENQTLASALAALAVARDQLWDRLDQIEGGQKIIDWFDAFAQNNSVQAGSQVAQFLLDTLSKAQTPDKGVATILAKLEDVAKVGA